MDQFLNKPEPASIRRAALASPGFVAGGGDKTRSQYAGIAEGCAHRHAQQPSKTAPKPLVSKPKLGQFCHARSAGRLVFSRFDRASRATKLRGEFPIWCALAGVAILMTFPLFVIQWWQGKWPPHRHN
jgi:hypothetical protein